MPACAEGALCRYKITVGNQRGQKGPKTGRFCKGHGMKTAKTALLHAGGEGEGRPTCERYAEGKAGL